MRLAPFAAPSILALAFPLSARAETPAPPPPPVESADRGAPIFTPKPRWYGLPIVAADAAILAAGLVPPLAVQSGSSEVVAGQSPWVLMGGLLTGPIVHLVHRDLGRALGSFAIRAVCLSGGFVGGYLTVQFAEKGQSSSLPGAMAWYAGTAAALAGASAIDAGALAFTRSRPPPRAVSVPAPFVTPVPGGALIGVGGAL